jgi:predicted  nucleic acid-binding Zn-ribbon protein
MGKLLEALLRVQSVERDLAHVRGRLKAQRKAAAVQSQRVEQARQEWEALHAQVLERRKGADSLDLELKGREQQVGKLRAALNSARTNKEYAAVLTQINSIKADNSKLEEEALKAMQGADVAKAEADQVQQQIDVEQRRLETVQASSDEEIARLNGMIEDLSARRAELSANIPQAVMAVFDRMAVNYDGDAMAAVERHGKKPPHTYVCGGCYMQLKPEHFNALRVRDEIRTCDNCGRILFLEPEAQQANR